MIIDDDDDDDDDDPLHFTYQTVCIITLIQTSTHQPTGVLNPYSGGVEISPFSPGPGTKNQKAAPCAEVHSPWCQGSSESPAAGFNGKFTHSNPKKKQ